MAMLVFFGVLALSALAIHKLLGPTVPKKDAVRRLQIIATSSTDESPVVLTASQGTSQGIAARVEALVRGFGFAKKLDRLLVHAGSTTTVGVIVSTSLALGLVTAFAAQLAVDFLPVTIAAGLAGGFARVLLLHVQKARRVKKFDAELVNSIELLTRALRAGHSVNSAIEIVAEQAAEPLGSEFAAVSQQQRFGMVFRTSMIELTERMPSKDLHFLVTAILVQKETGGDLTEILDRTARTIRERMRIAGEVRTKTAQGRFTGTILALLPVFMLILINILSPKYSTVLFHDPTGQKLLYAGATMIGIGAAIIHKIVDIKV